MELAIVLAVTGIGAAILGGLTEGIVKAWEFVERLENAE